MTSTRQPLRTRSSSCGDAHCDDDDDYQWTLDDRRDSPESPTRQGRTFRRRLSATEQCFVWDGRLNGTADSVQHTVLHLASGLKGDSSRSVSSDLFSSANITRAWLATKRRYPLAGAVVVVAESAGAAGMGADGGSVDEEEDELEEKEQEQDVFNLRERSGYFVVREVDLAVVRPGEIVFGEVKDAEEAQRCADALLNASVRPLSEELLVRMYVFRETGIIGLNRQVLHVMMMTAHCVADRMAIASFMRCFLDTLSRGGEEMEKEELPAQVPLEERLAMLLPAGEAVQLEPAHLRTLSPARRRWRRAAGDIIAKQRMEKWKGGHTLPCRLTRSTPRRPARSSHLSVKLTPAQTDAVLANCRVHDITFSNALLAIAQVAMTRVLFRRYLRGDISEKEWEYRKRQPHTSGSPLNIRPYLDRAWFERGGGGEFMLSMGLLQFQLPFMTLGVHHHHHTGVKVRSCSSVVAAAAARPNTTTFSFSDGAPPFADLLTFDRFLHRTGLVKKQLTACTKHPLFFEIARATSRGWVEYARLSVLGWMENVDRGSGEGDDHEVLAPSDIPMIWAHGGSSIGNVDALSPPEYPLPHTHPLSPYASVPHAAKAGYVTPPPSPTSTTLRSTTTTIIVEPAVTRLHARPGELYLSASTSRGEMSLFVFYDGHVYEEGVVREWLDEVKGGVLWYLGSRASKDSAGSGGRSGETGRGGDVVLGRRRRGACKARL